MIKEWLLAQILKNKVVLFENRNGEYERNRNGEYERINDIYFDDGVMICKFVVRE